MCKEFHQNSRTLSHQPSPWSTDCQKHKVWSQGSPWHFHPHLEGIAWRALLWSSARWPGPAARYQTGCRAETWRRNTGLGRSSANPKEKPDLWQRGCICWRGQWESLHWLLDLAWSGLSPLGLLLSCPACPISLSSWGRPSEKRQKWYKKRYHNKTIMNVFETCKWKDAIWRSSWADGGQFVMNLWQLCWWSLKLWELLVYARLLSHSALLVSYWVSYHFSTGCVYLLSWSFTNNLWIALNCNSI